VWTEHAGGWGTPAGKSMAVPVPPAPRTNDLTFVLQSGVNAVRANEPYDLFKGGAQIDSGMTDALGQVVVKDHQAATKLYKVKLADGSQLELKVSDALQKTPEHQLSNQGLRALASNPDRADTHGLDV
jgi:type VI secretion system secreted protein VgrG